MIELQEALRAVLGDLFLAYILGTVGMVFALYLADKFCNSQEF